MIVVFSKELRQFLSSPLAALLLAIYCFVFSALLYFSAYLNGNNDVSSLAANFTLFILLCNPLLGARLLAEDFRQKTHHLLLASPVSALQIVLGKYFSAVTFFVLILAVTLVPTAVFVYASSATLEFGAIALVYGQFFLVGLLALAIGIFCSGLTESVFLAGILAIFMVLLLSLLDFFASSLPAALRPATMAFALFPRLENLQIGVLALHDVLYFLLAIVFLLIGTLYLLERQRWRG